MREAEVVDIREPLNERNSVKSPKNNPFDDDSFVRKDAMGDSKTFVYAPCYPSRKQEIAETLIDRGLRMSCTCFHVFQITSVTGFVCLY
jgi:hypothetical protein